MTKENEQLADLIRTGAHCAAHESMISDEERTRLLQFAADLSQSPGPIVKPCDQRMNTDMDSKKILHVKGKVYGNAGAQEFEMKGDVVLARAMSVIPTFIRAGYNRVELQVMERKK